MEEFKLIARIMFAIYMWIACYNNTTGFTSTVGMLRALKIPAPTLIMPIVIVFELIAPILLFIPPYATYSALLLALFCVVAPTIAHAFWTMPDNFERFLHKNLFFANITIATGFLMLSAVN
jgi:uncharacterized membrane protein YphA (DoxX/SURF4 family)